MPENARPCDGGLTAATSILLPAQRHPEDRTRQQPLAHLPRSSPCASPRPPPASGCRRGLLGRRRDGERELRHGEAVLVLLVPHAHGRPCQRQPRILPRFLAVADHHALEGLKVPVCAQVFEVDVELRTTRLDEGAKGRHVEARDDGGHLRLDVALEEGRVLREVLHVLVFVLIRRVKDAAVLAHEGVDLLIESLIHHHVLERAEELPKLVRRGRRNEYILLFLTQVLCVEHARQQVARVVDDVLEIVHGLSVRNLCCGDLHDSP
mmetsp:Transcript_779/g.2189  ORF Transcript_779/g.2189 Transcript_779/m.2189 type:complete len:265 (-) Transcript_779:27-821(-)